MNSCAWRWPFRRTDPRRDHRRCHEQERLAVTVRIACRAHFIGQQCAFREQRIRHPCWVNQASYPRGTWRYSCNVAEATLQIPVSAAGVATHTQQAGVVALDHRQIFAAAGDHHVGHSDLGKSTSKLTALTGTNDWGSSPIRSPSSWSHQTRHLSEPHAQLGSIRHPTSCTCHTRQSTARAVEVRQRAPKH